jgi:Sulfotransferase family
MTAVTPYQLDFDDVVRQAKADTGLDDFGGDDLLDAFRVLVPALNREADLTEAGGMARRANLIRALSNRLRLQDAIVRHPAILDEPIIGPIVIVGLPRSGTTKLHRVIAADPGMQKLPLWKMLNPVPLPGAKDGEPDPRIAMAEEFEKMMNERQPALQAAHALSTHEAEEDVFVMEVTGRIYINCSAVRAPTFRRWLDAQSFDVACMWLRRILQVQQFFDRTRGRPWVLKGTQHMRYMPALSNVFPDMTVVHCHRGAPVNIASYAQMIITARRGISRVADAHDVGQYALSFWSEAVRRILHDREQLEKKHRFVDVAYRDILSDGIAVAEQVYAAAGLPFTDEARAAMRAWETINAQHKHGHHRYDLADTGLSEAQVEAAFADYNARFSHYF